MTVLYFWRLDIFCDKRLFDKPRINGKGGNKNDNQTLDTCWILWIAGNSRNAINCFSPSLVKVLLFAHKKSTYHESFRFHHIMIELLWSGHIESWSDCDIVLKLCKEIN